MAAHSDLALAASRGAWIALAAAFGFFALWETFAPWRQLRLAAARRWLVNLTLWAAGAACWRATIAIGTVGVAVVASRPAQPFEWWRFAGAILLLDLLRYAFHRAAHAIPWCWRVHRVHHSDPEVDCTTALRFHPLEAVVGHVWVMAWIYALGLPPLAVAVSELLTIGADVAEHANIQLPRRFAAAVGLALVIPETHRTHHSADPRDHGRNFGTVFIVWDRLLHTYAPAPERPLQFGAPELSADSSMSFVASLKAPFGEQ